MALRKRTKNPASATNIETIVSIVILKKFCRKSDLRWKLNRSKFSRHLYGVLFVKTRVSVQGVKSHGGHHFHSENLQNSKNLLLGPPIC